MEKLDSGTAKPELDPDCIAAKLAVGRGLLMCEDFSGVMDNADGCVLLAPLPKGEGM